MPFARRYATIALALLVVWSVAGLLFVPRLIAQAYGGHSLPFLNAIIEGNAAHPLSFYLDLWRRLFLISIGALIPLALGLYLLLRYRTRVTGAIRKVVVGTSDRRLKPVQTIVVAAAAGMITGFIEAAVLMIVALVEHSPRWGTGYTAGLLWMAPIANALAYAAFAGTILLLFVWLTRRPPLRLSIFLLAVLSFYALARSLRTGVHPVAIFMLSAGLAAQCARWVERRPEPLLRFSRRAIFAGLFACIALALAGPTFSGKSAVRRVLDSGWNVLLIVIDTGRASSFSLYGYTRPTTPNLDRFARDAVVFERAIAAAPWTLPSHATLFTGRWPIELSTDWGERLDDEYPTVAEVFADNGYATGAFVANEIYAGGRSGLERGFDVYLGDPVSLVMLFKNAWLTRNIIALVLGGGDATDPLHGLGRKRAHDVRGEFLRWVDSRKQQEPFFAFLNYMESHPPFLADSPYDTMYAGRYVQVRPRFFRGYTPEEIRGFTDAYDQSLTALDSDLGRLFNGLRERGLLDRTVVIVTADHGEQLGERNRRELLHANSLYMPLLHVPLIIRIPGGTPGQRRVAREVSLRDLGATMLDLASVPNEDRIPGNHLTSLWQGSGAVELSPAVSQLSLIEAFGDVARSRGEWSQSVVAKGYHYIIDGHGRQELYDVRLDPWERNDLSATPVASAVVPRLRARLRAASRE